MGSATVQRELQNQAKQQLEDASLSSGFSLGLLVPVLVLPAAGGARAVAPSVVAPQAGSLHGRLD